MARRWTKCRREEIRNRMVADHSKANNELTALAQKKGVGIKSEK